MTDNAPAKKSYKDTLNLPNTKFGMKANLVQTEPASQKRWADAKIYEKLRLARKGSPKYVFHDGPPYANGNIHLGHLLNKVLKDLVVRSRTLMGFDCPYIPGWDCHGLPIEHKVVADLGPKAREMSPLQIRYKCKDYAEKFVKLQSGQMQRLLTLADYANPYLTLHPAYEKASLEVFADMVGLGLVYRALKPVHWSIANRTALADAELEYEDREDTSVYVLFEITNPSDLPGSAKLPAGVPLHLMIWTTTPWTLPANLAVAAAERAEYGIYQFTHAGKTKLAVIAADLAAKVLSFLGKDTPVEPLHVIKGADLAKLRYKHPFIDRTSPVVFAEYVTLEDGTGLVHTAPGHGVEDYQTGLREKIRFSADRKSIITGELDNPLVRADTYCPVREDGTYDPSDTSIPQWLRAEGVDVWKANGLVVDRMKADGTLFFSHQFMHSYPHDWRSKTPIIFRATHQWFVSVDMPVSGGGSIRQRSIDSTKDITFYPDWGKNRLKGMLESRPDWCISRQRAWGLPIPAFFNADGEPLLTKASVLAVAKNVTTAGSDLWFKSDAAQILAGYDPKSDPEAPAWAHSVDLATLTKSNDIFDVWFDSGTSWAAVIRQRGLGHAPGTGPITDLYLEGSDQHRGWFQASLLPAIATTGHAPFKNLLTHGFMVDKHGKKMSKTPAKEVMVDQVKTNIEQDEALQKKIKPADLLAKLGMVNKTTADSDDVRTRRDADPELQKLFPTTADLDKLLSNTILVEELIPKLGADVARWWVSTLNVDNDIKVDWSYFHLAGEEYRKVRNTIRYLLSNLNDFDPGVDRYVFAEGDAASLDAWVLYELNRVIKTVRESYDRFDFKNVSETIFNFCNQTLSAVYLAATKDRMYCDKKDSFRRRRAQTAMYEIVSALVRMVAPILPHTADEAWAFIPGPKEDSVHLALFPDLIDVSVHTDWPAIIKLRDGWLKVIEETRKSLSIDNPLDLGLHLPGTDEGIQLWSFAMADLADLCGVSRVDLSSGTSDAKAVDLRGQPKCERSWKRDGTVEQRSDGGLLSLRDAKALGLE
jgi:isoleucyl-tRNA synthetase